MIVNRVELGEIQSMRDIYRQTSNFWVGESAEKTRGSFESRIVPKFEDMLDVLNKPLQSTFVVIDEVDLDNWGGLPVEEYRKRLKGGS